MVKRGLTTANLKDKGNTPEVSDISNMTKISLDKKAETSLENCDGKMSERCEQGFMSFISFIKSGRRNG